MSLILHLKWHYKKHMSSSGSTFTDLVHIKYSHPLLYASSSILALVSGLISSNPLCVSTEVEVSHSGSPLVFPLPRQKKQTNRKPLKCIVFGVYYWTRIITRNFVTPDFSSAMYIGEMKCLSKQKNKTLSKILVSKCCRLGAVIKMFLRY